MTNAIAVSFHGSELYIVNHNGEPFTPMKPIVEGMGMDWKSQFIKLKQRFKTCVVEITMQLPGDNQRRSVICLALRKLAAWLNTISPNKVRPEIRERVIQYQQECDDVLYEYWTSGQVKPKQKSRQCTATQLIPLRQTAERLITTGLGKIYPDIWRLVHQRFDIQHIQQLRPEQVSEAVEYLNILEGEYLQRRDKPTGQRRFMLYVSGSGSVTSTIPIADNEIVMSLESFTQLARQNGWIIAPKEDLAKSLERLVRDY